MLISVSDSISKVLTTTLIFTDTCTSNQNKILRPWSVVVVVVFFFLFVFLRLTGSAMFGETFNLVTRVTTVIFGTLKEGSL